MPLALAVALASARAALSETHVQGDVKVSTTWTLAGSPYVLDGHVAVYGPGAPTLTIEPGVVVVMGGGLAIYVGVNGPGDLHAIGTPAKPIVFSAGGERGARWDSLQIGRQSGGSRLENVVVEGGGYWAQGMVRVMGASPSLRGVSVRGGLRVGVSVEGESAPTLADLSVSGTTGSDGAGIAIGARSRVVLRGGSVGPGGGHGIAVASGAALDATGSAIVENGGAAIAIEVGAELGGLTGLRLSGNGQDAVRLAGGEIRSNTTLKDFGFPYLLEGSLWVRGPGAPTLVVEPGVVVRVARGLAVSIGDGERGRLQAVGTTEKPVVFTPAGPVTPGWWDGLVFGPGSGGSRLEHAVVEGGGYWDSAGIRVSGSTSVFRNVVVRTSRAHGVLVGGGGVPEFTNVTVTGTSWVPGPGFRLFAGSSARIERSTASENAGPGILNEGSRSSLRAVTLSGNGGEGLLNASGELVLRDGAVSGAHGSIRNADNQNRVVDARHQWWGAPTGPAGIEGRVEFDPWLAAPPSPDFAVTSVEVSTRAFPAVASSCRFDLELPSPGAWVLRLLGPDGAEARRFEGAGRAASVSWNGTTAAGQALVDGAYAFRVDATEGTTARVASPLFGRLVLDASLPVAVLSAPAGIARVRVGDELTVEGSASGADFESYVLELGAGDFPSGWTLVDRGSLAVPSGRLGSLTTALLPTGRYVLRLTVSSDSGKTAVAVARLDVTDEGECR